MPLSSRRFLQYMKYLFQTKNYIFYHYFVCIRKIFSVDTINTRCLCRENIFPYTFLKIFCYPIKDRYVTGTSYLILQSRCRNMSQHHLMAHVAIFVCDSWKFRAIKVHMFYCIDLVVLNENI